MYHQSPKSKLRELGSMLLSNITKHEAVASFIVRIEIPMYLTPVPYLPLSRSATSIRTTDLPTEKPITRKALDLLLTAFDEGSGVEGVNEQSSKKSPLQFLGTMFANISIVRALIVAASFDIMLHIILSYQKVVPSSFARINGLNMQTGNIH